jgi:hypothetical protein
LSRFLSNSTTSRFAPNRPKMRHLPPKRRRVIKSWRAGSKRVLMLTSYSTAVRMSPVGGGTVRLSGSIERKAVGSTRPTALLQTQGGAMRRHSHKPNWCVRRFLPPPPRQGRMVQARSHVVRKNKQLRIVAPAYPGLLTDPTARKPPLGCRPDYDPSCCKRATHVAKRQRHRRLGSSSRRIP